LREPPVLNFGSKRKEGKSIKRKTESGGKVSFWGRGGKTIVLKNQLYSQERIQ